MTAASELTAAFLDKAKGVLVSTHGLNAGLWDTARAEAHQEDLASLADYAGNLGLDQAQAAVFDLYAYISVFTEGTLHPNPAQRQELGRLIEQAQAAAPATNQGSLRDVQHIVVLMQENRSFDHLFGALNGVPLWLEKENFAVDSIAAAISKVFLQGMVRR